MTAARSVGIFIITFSGRREARLRDELLELLGDPLFRQESPGPADLDDLVSTLLDSKCDADLQCLDLHGVWVHLCVLVDTHSFGTRPSLGWSVSAAWLWNPRRPPRAP